MASVVQSTNSQAFFFMETDIQKLPLLSWDKKNTKYTQLLLNV